MFGSVIHSITPFQGFLCMQEGKLSLMHRYDLGLKYAMTTSKTLLRETLLRNNNALW